MEDTQKQITGTLPQSRLFNLTDSIFAFAITLLVLNLIQLRLPTGSESLVPTLKENAATFITFIITFIIIARFWTSHTRLFAAIRECDRRIVDLNLTLLFFITIFPFVASVLGSHMHNRDAVILYAACFAIIGFLQFLIGKHAYTKELLISDDLNRNFLKIFTFFTLSTPIVFMVSIALAFISPILAEVLWVLLVFLRSAFKYYYRNNNAVEREVEKL